MARSGGALVTAIEPRRAAIEAPTGGGFLRDDTVVIRREGWYQRVTPSTRGLNEVVLSKVAAEHAEAVIDREVTRYHTLGLPVKWCVGAWTEPQDFGERLARRGFARWEVRGMGTDTALDVGVPAGIEVSEVEPADLDAYLDANLRGWSIPEAQREAERACLLRELGSEGRCGHLWIARADGEVVGTTGLLLREGYGYLVGAQVLEPARGRGVYRALIAARLGWLRARGVPLAVTQARESSSAPILERLGFETLFRSHCFLLEPDHQG